MSSGVYYSRLEGEYKYLWAFTIPSEEHPAHFGTKSLLDVVWLYLETDYAEWCFEESDSKFCVLPERVLKWR